MKSLSNVVGYKSGTSHKTDFLSVTHQNDFSPRLRDLMVSVPWNELGELVYTRGETDIAGRNNLLASFGYSTSMNQELMKTANQVLRNHGAHVPNLLKGTREPLIKNLFSTCSALASEIGVWYATPNFDDDQFFRERQMRFSALLGNSSDNVFEALSIAAYPYCSIPPQDDDSPAEPLRDHTDSENCPVYADTCGFSTSISLRGKLTRIVVVAYMRKSILHAFRIGRASEETLRNVRAFINESEVYRHPSTDFCLN